MENLGFMIKYLLDEGNYSEEIPVDNLQKRNLYRALVNVREPKPISDEFLQKEDIFLQELLSDAAVTNIDKLPTISDEYVENSLKNPDKMCIWRGDITKLKIDAIVNAANSGGLGCFLPNHNCIDNQIHTFAGVRMRLECNEYMKTINNDLKTSKCFITKGYNLPCEKVIHTVGPIVPGFLTDALKHDLENTYLNCLKCAVDNGVKTISFPCISTGVFRFPKNEASIIAIKTVDRFLSENDGKIDKVVFNLWSEEDVTIYERNIK